MACVAFVALGLYAYRVYEDGPSTRWLLWKLRYGSVQTRREAAREIKTIELGGMFGSLVGGTFSDSEPRQALVRRSALFCEALLQAVTDPDARCRAESVSVLSVSASFHGSEDVRRRALRAVFVAMADPDPSVRAAACRSFAGLFAGSGGAVIRALETAMDDPSPEVRAAAISEFGSLGVIHPETQAGVAPLLIRHLAGTDDPSVRIHAVSSLAHIGQDHRRNPSRRGPDVVPALVSALSDPAVEVRRRVTHTFGWNTRDNQGRVTSSWSNREGAIRPALAEMLQSEDDQEAKRNAALALFEFGDRSSAVLDFIEHGSQTYGWSDGGNR